MSTRDKAAKVTLTDAEREVLWKYVRIAPSNHDRSQITAAVKRIVAARVEHAEEALADAWDEGYYAGEGADRDSFYWRGHPGGTNPYRAALRGD